MSARVDGPTPREELPPPVAAALRALLALDPRMSRVWVAWELDAVAAGGLPRASVRYEFDPAATDEDPPPSLRAFDGGARVVVAVALACGGNGQRWEVRR